MNDWRLRSFVLTDYDAVFELWRSSEGVGLNDSDSREAIARLLERNPGLSFVAEAEGAVIGAILCSHDGRRGYLHHLAVTKASRRRGVGRSLVLRGLEELRKAGIPKANIFLFRANAAGKEFWLREGWKAREDIVLLQKFTEPES